VTGGASPCAGLARNPHPLTPDRPPADAPSRLTRKDPVSPSSIVLANTNAMTPPVAPVGLDYLADALRRAGHSPELLDLCFARDMKADIESFLRARRPQLVGITFRNSDDCFWPSGRSFVPRLTEIVSVLRRVTDAPIVIGGNGFSFFPQAILAATGADYGIVGDGEGALPQLLDAVQGMGRFEDVSGLVRRGGGGEWMSNPPVRGDLPCVASPRSFVDNRRYFREGGQMGLETKRGCDGACVYCVDPVSKGSRLRLRPPEAVCGEIEALRAQGVDVLHLCDAEFNRPPEHALEVCRAIAARGLSGRVRWYAYLSAVPFTPELAAAMRRAGCVGINFGVDHARDDILAALGRDHRRRDIAEAVRLCRAEGITVMLDLLLGGPGETRDTLRETMEFLKGLSPDCVGSALGVRVYPGTEFARRVAAEGPAERNPNLRRIGPPVRQGEALLQPTFYISAALGERPAQVVRELIAGDTRFFEPMDEQCTANYNYNDNRPLVDAIAAGARGAYWDILRKLRS
jgi:radical SAM superfamily enzyme YgiQ (UPF0313 family)